MVYMGNNEMVGPFGAGTIFGPAAPPVSLVRASLAAKTLKVGETAGADVGRPALEKRQPKKLGRLEHVQGASVTIDNTRTSWRTEILE